jgi:glycosyltransferase involved in cell wall biosynthesis
LTTKIYRESRRKNLILANGLFLEVWIASRIFGFKYAVKVPGDIVWERARNKSKTKLTIDDFQNEYVGWKYALFRNLYSRSLRNAKQVIVPSEHLFSLCQLWGVSTEKIHLVHNSVFIDQFKSVQQNMDFDVLTVARLVKWKGIDQIIKVCADNKLRLLVIGDGPEMQNLKRTAHETGANVVFTGDVAQGELPNYYSRCKSFVLNSNFEASSYSLIEAMACSLPVIASRRTGSAEVVRHSVDGYLVDENFSLAEAIKTLFEDPGLALEMGKNARERVASDFNSELNFQRIAAIVSLDSI